MTKKAGAVKEKGNGRLRPDKTAAEAVTGKEVSDSKQASGEKVRSALKNSELPAQAKTEKKGANARGKDEKKVTARTRDAAKPKRPVFKDMVNFFKGTWSELKKVHWPNRSEIVVYTSVVIGSVVFVALLIWVVDSILSHLLELLL